MFRTVVCFSFTFLLVGVSGVGAEDKARASTQQLPAALLSANINASKVVLNKRDAHRVRGQGSCTTCTTCTTPTPPPPPTPNPCPSNCGPHMVQTKTFTVTGTATGTVLLFEGIVGEVKHTQTGTGSSTVVEANFGGVAGFIGAGPGGILQFQLEGKALQEQLTFTGAYTQTFNQVYSN